MIGILLTAVLSSSPGQAPLIMPNSMDYYPNAFKRYGAPIFSQNLSSGYSTSDVSKGSSPVAFGSYPVSQTYPLYGAVGGYGTAAMGYGYGPACFGGCYDGVMGAYCGFYPGCGYGGYGGYGYPPSMPLPIAYAGTGDQDREQREINRRLEEMKGTLERDVKGTLDKLSDSLKQAEKRLEATEKIGLSTEGRVKWLEDEVKQRLYWLDMEKKLDSRMKPLEKQLEELLKKLDKHDEMLRLHDEKQRLQHQDLERRREMPKAGEPKGPEPRPTEPKAEDPLKSIEAKLDKLQGNITKDMTSVLTRLVELEMMIKEERQRREKIEERLKKLEKVAPPKEGNAPQENGAPKESDPPPLMEPSAPMNREAAGLPKARVAQASLSPSPVPANKALVIVSIPAEAKLYLNDQLTHVQGALRSFMTPELAPGGTFSYTFRMETFQNGASRTQTQIITFRPGQRVHVDFSSSNETRVAGGQE